MRQTITGSVELLRVAWHTGRGKLALSVVLMVLQAVSMPLAAPALAALTDDAVAGDARGASVAAVVVAVLVVASLTAGHFAHVFYFELGDLAVMRLERDLIALSHASPGIEHHERPEYADRLQVLRSELNRSGWGSMQALLSAIGLAIALVITAVLLAGLNPWLLLLPLTAVPPLVLGRRAEATLGRARDAAATDNRRARHLFGLVLDAGAAKEVRACNLADELRARHRRSWDAASATLWRGEVRADALRASGQLVFAAGYVLATLLVLRDALRGHRTVGDVVLVITLAAQVNQQVTAAVTILQQLQRAAATMAGLRWMRAQVEAQGRWTTPDEAAAAGRGAVDAPTELHDGIRFSGVSFTYPGTDRPVLEGLDLDLPAGTSVAIVGENGAGKSTLVKLLCRFYTPTAGSITVDGVPLGSIRPDSWRDSIAAGFQDFCRFELLARQNVGVGDLPRVEDDEAVLAALERAHSDDVLARLEQGLDTQLGTSHTDGAQLSGGQWQKLALGRAFMRPAPILVVLDEPTSALDAKAEHDLYERYAAHAREVGRRTGAVTLLVSHRFSTVRMADLILVVADHGIVERGTHEELVAAGGVYAELYDIQAAAYR